MNMGVTFEKQKQYDKAVDVYQEIFHPGPAPHKIVDGEPVLFLIL